MDAELFIDEALNPGLEAVFQTILTGRDFVINRTAG